MFKHKEIIGILIITLIITFFYLGTMFYYTMGHLSAPLDDTFIFLQYAWQLIHGHPLQYNTGDPPTTGATSMIYPLFLIPGFLIGLDKTNILYYTFSLGVVFLTISGWLVFKIGRRLINDKIGVLMCLLFLFNGPILWVYLSGMDAGLFSLSILATMYSLLLELEDKEQRYTRTIWASSLMTLTRPEGFILSVIIFSYIFWSKRIKSYYFLIPIALGIGQIGINYLFNGTLSANTMTAKSVLTKPNVNLLDMMATSGKYCVYILKDIFSGFNGEFSALMETNEGRQVSVYFAPFSLIFFLIGILFIILKERSKFGIVISSCFFIGILAVATALPFKWHWHRYLIPYYPIFLIFTLLGIYYFSELMGKAISSLNPKYVFYGLVSFCLCFGFLSTVYFGVAYGKNCKDIYFQQITLGKWIDKSLPREAIIAVNDLGALKYFGNRYVIDLLGLGTKGVARIWVNGAGSIYEYLENLEPKYYPQYFIIYPNWFVFDRLGMLEEEIAQFKLLQPTIAGSGAPMVVYKIDWGFAHSGDKIQSLDILTQLEGYKLVDRVDVADIENELKHRYKFWESEPGMYYGMNYQDQVLKLPCLEAPDKIVIDAGRMITAGECMVVETEVGKDLKIIKRTNTFTPLEVFVNDKLIGLWTHHNVEEQWSETVYGISGKHITSNKTKIRFEIHRELKHHYTCFSAHYWFYQRG
ncbi:MAG: hypothetical protein AB1414_13300 [bacterium]